MNAIKRILKRRLIVIPAALIVGGVLVYAVMRGRQPQAETITVQRGTITQEVNITGKTKPAEDVDLAFEKGGKIAKVETKVGNRVTIGQILAALDVSELTADLGEAEANADTQRAKLNELKRGTRPEKIRIDETKAENARTAVEDAKKNLSDKLQDSYTKSDDAVRNRVDQFFSNPRSTNPQVSFTMDDQPLKLSLERERLTMETALNSWKTALDSLTASSDLAAYTVNFKKNLDQVRSLLDKAALALNTLKPNTAITQTTIDSYRSDVSTARTNVNTAINNLSAAEEKLRSAQSSLALAENELSLSRAGTSAEEVAAQVAQAKQAEAKVASVQAQLAKSLLYAPISGTVTRQDAKVGEIAAANAILVSIISASNLEIEANVPEVDIGKAAVGNAVKITLDAFPGEAFSGRVSYVDPAETIVDGVVNFKVTILFDRADSRFKSGLTANLDIETLRKSDTLILPQFAIIENDQGTFVKKVEGGETMQIPVKIGIRDQVGGVEILEGLTAGDQVLNIGFKTSAK